MFSSTMVNSITIYLGSLLMFCYFCLYEGAVQSKEQALITELLDGYEKDARPVPSGNKSYVMTLFFGVEIVQLIDVDDRNQMITTNVWVRQRWRNLLLTWDDKRYHNITQVRIQPDLLWIPDIVLYNSADRQFSGGLEKYKTRVILSSDGENAWYAPTSFRSTCNIDVTYFPFDEQHCFLKFGSWTFGISDMDIEADETEVLSTKYVKSAEWDILRATKYRNMQYYACCEHPFADLTVDIILRRKPLFYAFNLITPCMIMLGMILLGFFLPPESGERITLSITVLLAMAVFLQLVAESLPRNSDTIPLLGVFYITIMSEIGCSLVATCLILNIHHRNTGTSVVPIPYWIDVIIIRLIGNILCVRNPSTYSSTEYIQSQGKKYEQVNGETAIPVNENGKCCNAHEAALHCNAQCISGKIAEKKLFSPIQRLLSQKNISSQHAHSSCDYSRSDHQLYDDIHMMAQSVKHQAEVEENREKWKHVAMVLDRFFFWVFILIILLSTAIIFKAQI